MSQKKCSRCGRVVDEMVRFCPACGSSEFLSMVSVEEESSLVQYWSKQK